jgi:L,D-transpeptidase YnhG
LKILLLSFFAKPRQALALNLHAVKSHTVWLSIEPLAKLWMLWGLAALLVVGQGVWAAQDSLSPVAGQDALTNQGKTENFSWGWDSPALNPGVELSGPTPEPWLRAVYEQMALGRSDVALELASQLSRQFPNFQLGHFLYADLLNLGLPQPWTEKQVIAPHPGAAQQLDHLLHEARQRLGSPNPSQLQHRIPAGVYRLSPVHFPYLVVVDAKHSRLYWFTNKNEPGRSGRLELLFETYVSVGAKGVGKQSEGDLRTPVGMYSVQSLLDGQRLPDFYGPGALVLNYPNQVDHLLKRTGSGIWLHGTPSQQYSRAPLATEGCVVLPNNELKKVLRLPQLRGTPVMIQPEIEWVPPSAPSGSDPFELALKRYLQTRVAHRRDSADLYSASFVRDGKGTSEWWRKLRGAQQMAGTATEQEIVSVLGWKDKGDWREVITTPARKGNRVRPGTRIKTYWRLEPDRHWRIVFEGPAV